MIRLSIHNSPVRSCNIHAGKGRRASGDANLEGCDGRAAEAARSALTPASTAVCKSPVCAQRLIKTGNLADEAGSVGHHVLIRFQTLGDTANSCVALTAGCLYAESFVFHRSGALAYFF